MIDSCKRNFLNQQYTIKNQEIILVVKSTKMCAIISITPKIIFLKFIMKK